MLKILRDRIMLNVMVKRDGMSVTRAARFLGMAPSWGVKWHNRYLKEGTAGLQLAPAQAAQKFFQPARLCYVDCYCAAGSCGDSAVGLQEAVID